MPGNEVEDRFHSLFELSNTSPGQNPSQTFGGHRPLLNYNQQVSNLGQNAAPLSFSLNNSTPQSGSVKGKINPFLQAPCDRTFTHLNLRPEDSRHLSRSDLLNTFGYMHGHQNFQRWQNQVVCSDENTEIGWHNLTSASTDSPTLTANSEKSEIVEASSDLNFLGWQQQHLVRGQQLSTLQPPSMQQSGFNDMQILQQTIMFKQLQEMQRQQQQQQLQQLGEVRQQNSINQFSAIAKQAAGGQLPLLINGTPVRDTSQMFMNLMQRSSSPAGQGVPNRMTFPQEQNQTMRSMGLVSQQLDVSLHGTPVGGAGGSMNQYSHMQGMSRGSANLFNKASSGNQTQKPTLQSTFSNPFPGDHDTFSSDNVCMPQGAFASKQGFAGKNAFGQVSQHGNILHMNAPLPDFNGRQEQVGNLETMQQKTTQFGPSRGLIPLDPLEQKILYNMDDSSWDTGFGKSMDTGAGGFGSALEQSDYSSALQSGSWSALMQTAVAEASSSDTGVQEEWSGLTFQNTELSTDNQPSKFMDEERQQPGWANSNLQCASSDSKPFTMINDPSMISSFPGFQQSAFQSSNEHGQGLQHYDSQKSYQKSPRSAGEWSDCNPQPKSSNQIGQHIQPLTHLENTWAGQNYEHPESHMHRMASHNKVSQLCNEQKGDNVAGAMDKGRDLDGYSWSGQMEQLHHLTNNPMREDAHVNHFAAAPNLGTSKVHLPGQKATDQLDYIKQVDFSMDNNEMEIGRETQYLLGRNQTINNSYEGAGDPYEKLNNSYSPKGLSGPQQGRLGQINIIGNMSKNSMSLDQGGLPDFRGNSTASEQVVMGGDGRSSSSTTCGQTVGSNGQHVAPQTSQHMLELLHKVNRSRENSPMAHFSSTDHNSLSEGPKADAHDTHIAQMFNQRSASQGFGLKLAPPSQRLPNSSCLRQDSPHMVSNLNPRQVNPELGVKNLGWPDSSSSVRLLPSNEFPQRAHWDEKSSSSGQTNVIPNMNMQGTCDATLTSGLQHVRNQLQTEPVNEPAVGESSQATPIDSSSRFPPFKLASSQQAFTNPFDQSFPVVETASLSQPSVMPGMSPRSGMSGRLQSTWKNVPTSRLSSAAPSIDPSKNSMETTSLASQKGRTLSSDLGACSVNSQGSEYGDQPGKHRFRQEMSSEILDTLQSGGLSEVQESVVKHIPSSSNQQDPDRVLHGDNHASSASERNLESFGRSLKASQTLHQSYTLLHQMQGMKGTTETDPSKNATRQYNEADSVANVQQVSDIAGQQSIYDHNSRFRNQTHIGPDLSRLNSSSSGDPKMLSFLMDAREDLGGKALSQPVLQPLQGIGTFNQKEFQSQTNNMVNNHAENSLMNLRMAPTWFKQYSTFKNGQMQPMYDARLAKAAMEQFTPGKLSPNLPIFTTVDQRGAALPRPVGSIAPGTTGSLVASENFSAQHVLPSDLVEQSRPDVRAKKRKSIRSEHIPWHKEVTQGSQRLQDISTAEHDWAYTTNRLAEKIEYVFELPGEEQPMHHRSKRRLILTTQLMQQLFRPAPAPVLLGDASSRYDGVTYSIAKLALGDACSLTYGSKNDLQVAQGNSDMIPEKPKASESHEHFTKLVEDFSVRAKKLENDFSRLESVSVLDIRVDCQDLERYSAINRFAKFHMRGQGDTSVTSSSATPMSPPKSSPQKYVTALPMPRNLPEEAQCFSL